MAYVLDPALILKAQGFDPDEFQESLVRCDYHKLILNLHRQSGKSSIAVAKAIQVLLKKNRALVLIGSPIRDQAMETFDKLLWAYECIGEPVPIVRKSRHGMLLANRSRVVCLSGRERSVRSYSQPDMILMDEASRIPDEVFRAIGPMRLRNPLGLFWVISTPFGERGFFWRTWTDQLKLPQQKRDWLCIQRTVDQSPWVSPEFIDSEIRQHGQSYVEQEYYCQFRSGHGLVYPDLALPLELDAQGRWVRGCVVNEWPNPQGRLVGGIDWGFARDPYAGVWGVHERATDILWIAGEHYATGMMPRDNLERLPRDHLYWCDHSRPESREEAVAAGWQVQTNSFLDVPAGVAAVTSRIQTGRLRIYGPRCPNILEEGGLYRYREYEEGNQKRESRTAAALYEGPEHALDGIRYMTVGIDRHHINRFRKLGGDLGEHLKSVKVAERPRWKDKEGNINMLAAWNMPCGGGPGDFWRGDDDDD